VCQDITFYGKTTIKTFAPTATQYEKPTTAPKMKENHQSALKKKQTELFGEISDLSSGDDSSDEDDSTYSGYSDSE
jgi:hypothetical protein